VATLGGELNNSLKVPDVQVDEVLERRSRDEMGGGREERLKPAEFRKGRCSRDQTTAKKTLTRKRLRGPNRGKGTKGRGVSIPVS